MAISPFKTFLAGEVLFASDLNSSFSHLTDNALSMISPLTGNLDLDGNEFILDADADSSLSAATDDLVVIKTQGQELFRIDGRVTSVVNGFDFVLSVTGVAVALQALGTDTNIDMNAIPKGTGQFQINGRRALDIRDRVRSAIPSKVSRVFHPWQDASSVLAAGTLM